MTLRAAERITSTRDSLQELNKRVQVRIADLRDVPTADAADIDEIERQLYARIDRTRDWIGAMQSGVDLLQQIIEMTESSALFLRKDSNTFKDLVKSARAGHEEIEQAAALFDEMNRHFVEIQANHDIDVHAKQFTSLYSRIDGSLDKVQDYTRSFETGVSQSRSECSRHALQIRRWLYLAAVILTLLLLWILIAQTSLAIHSWKLIRARANARRVDFDCEPTEDR